MHIIHRNYPHYRFYLLQLSVASQENIATIETAFLQLLHEELVQVRALEKK